jgi:uncharacterized protein (DUF952 family)
VVPIFHIALATDWEQAVAAGEYRVSTLGRSLEEEGFLHMSYAVQWPGVLDAGYRDVPEPLVLPSRTSTARSRSMRWSPCTPIRDGLFTVSRPGRPLMVPGPRRARHGVPDQALLTPEDADQGRFGAALRVRPLR